MNVSCAKIILFYDHAKNINFQKEKHTILFDNSVLV